MGQGAPRSLIHARPYLLHVDHRGARFRLAGPRGPCAEGTPGRDFIDRSRLSPTVELTKELVLRDTGPSAATGDRRHDHASSDRHPLVRTRRTLRRLGAARPTDAHRPNGSSRPPRALRPLLAAVLIVGTSIAPQAPATVRAADDPPTLENIHLTGFLNPGENEGDPNEVTYRFVADVAGSPPLPYTVSLRTSPAAEDEVVAYHYEADSTLDLNWFATCPAGGSVFVFLTDDSDADAVLDWDELEAPGCADLFFPTIFARTTLTVAVRDDHSGLDFSAHAMAFGGGGLGGEVLRLVVGRHRQ